VIFAGVLAAAFFYFMVAIAGVGWPVYLFFAIVVGITLVFHGKRHFRTEQITLIFLYLISLLLWSKDALPLVPQFVYILGGATLSFILSDLFFKVFFKILSWTLVGITIALLMYERFGSLLVAILVAMIVIPIALRDREHVRHDKN
jgi:hypothetical protein